MRAASEEQLIREHDVIAAHTVAGTSYYLDELHRRDQLAAIRSSQRLARASLVLAVVSALASVAAVVIAVLTLLAST